MSKILAQLQKYPKDWESQKQMEGIGSLLDRGYDDIPAGVLQLVVGAVAKAEDFVGDSEYCVATPAYDKHTEMIGFLKRNFKKSVLMNI